MLGAVQCANATDEVKKSKYYTRLLCGLDAFVCWLLCLVVLFSLVVFGFWFGRRAGVLFFFSILVCFIILGPICCVLNLEHSNLLQLCSSCLQLSERDSGLGRARDPGFWFF